MPNGKRATAPVAKPKSLHQSSAIGVPPTGTRQQRWRDAVAELLTLQAEYTAWLGALPDSLKDTDTAEALQTIVELDLDALAGAEPPRGYGRD